MRYFFSILVLFFTFSLCAQENEMDCDDDLDEWVSSAIRGDKEDAVPQPPFLEALPSAVVAGCVNAIKGDFSNRKSIWLYRGLNP